MGDQTNQSAVLDFLRNHARSRATFTIPDINTAHDVTDASMTPENIVTTALQHGLAVVAVTDHNEIMNVAATLNAREHVPVAPMEPRQDLLTLLGKRGQTPSTRTSRK